MNLMNEHMVWRGVFPGATVRPHCVWQETVAQDLRGTSVESWTGHDLLNAGKRITGSFPGSSRQA
eukprot:558154-Hanusia_phi.AAC.1